MSLNSEKKPTLLLVDDDAIIADSLEYVLSDEYQVERATDRSSSFALIDSMEVSPTLALIDLGLPPNTHRPDEGLAVIRKIAQMHPSTRVLVLREVRVVDVPAAVRREGDEPTRNPEPGGDGCDVVDHARPPSASHSAAANSFRLSRSRDGRFLRSQFRSNARASLSNSSPSMRARTTLCEPFRSLKASPPSCGHR